MTSTGSQRGTQSTCSAPGEPRIWYQRGGSRRRCPNRVTRAEVGWVQKPVQRWPSPRKEAQDKANHWSLRANKGIQAFELPVNVRGCLKHISYRKDAGSAMGLDMNRSKTLAMVRNLQSWTHTWILSLKSGLGTGNCLTLEKTFYRIPVSGQWSLEIEVNLWALSMRRTWHKGPLALLPLCVVGHALVSGKGGLI